MDPDLTTLRRVHLAAPPAWLLGALQVTGDIVTRLQSLSHLAAATTPLGTYGLGPIVPYQQPPFALPYDAAGGAGAQARAAPPSISAAEAFVREPAHHLEHRAYLPRQRDPRPLCRRLVLMACDYDPLAPWGEYAAALAAASAAAAAHAAHADASAPFASPTARRGAGMHSPSACVEHGARLTPLFARAKLARINLRARAGALHVLSLLASSLLPRWVAGAARVDDGSEGGPAVEEPLGLGGEVEAKLAAVTTAGPLLSLVALVQWLWFGSSPAAVLLADHAAWHASTETDVLAHVVGMDAPISVGVVAVGDAAVRREALHALAAVRHPDGVTPASVVTLLVRVVVALNASISASAATPPHLTCCLRDAVCALHAALADVVPRGDFVVTPATPIGRLLTVAGDALSHSLVLQLAAWHRSLDEPQAGVPRGAACLPSHDESALACMVTATAAASPPSASVWTTWLRQLLHCYLAPVHAAHGTRNPPAVRLAACHALLQHATAAAAAAGPSDRAAGACAQLAELLRSVAAHGDDDALTAWLPVALLSVEWATDAPESDGVGLFRARALAPRWEAVVNTQEARMAAAVAAGAITSNAVHNAADVREMVNLAALDCGGFDHALASPPSDAIGAASGGMCMSQAERRALGTWRSAPAVRGVWGVLISATPTAEPAHGLVQSLWAFGHSVMARGTGVPASAWYAALHALGGDLPWPQPAAAPAPAA